MPNSSNARKVTSPPLVVGLGEILWDELPNGQQLLGGAPANVAWHAKCLGARSAVISAVGNDPSGHRILDRLDGKGIDRTQVAIDKNHPTGIAKVVLEVSGKTSFRIEEGVAWDHLALNPNILIHAKDIDAIAVGTLAQRCELSRRSIQAILRATRSDCLRVFDVNLRQEYFNSFSLSATLSRQMRMNGRCWPPFSGSLLI